MSAPLPPGTPSKLGFNTFAMWGLCAVVVGVSDGPPASWTRWLSITAVGGAVAVIALTYAVSSYYGHLPGFTEDDYRLSAAWDRPPATELATIGLALSLDLLPLLELARPAHAPVWKSTSVSGARASGGTCRKI